MVIGLAEREEAETRKVKGAHLSLSRKAKVHSDSMYVGIGKNTIEECRCDYCKVIGMEWKDKRGLLPPQGSKSSFKCWESESFCGWVREDIS